MTVIAKRDAVRIKSSGLFCDRRWEDKSCGKEYELWVAFDYKDNSPLEMMLHCPACGMLRGKINLAAVLNKIADHKRSLKESGSGYVCECGHGGDGFDGFRRWTKTTMTGIVVDNNNVIEEGETPQVEIMFTCLVCGERISKEDFLKDKR